MKKAKHHLELAAMAGHEMARHNHGVMEGNSGNRERAIRHLTISASAGHRDSMTVLLEKFEKGFIQREVYQSMLKAYNDSCVEMTSKAREDALAFISTA